MAGYNTWKEFAEEPLKLVPYTDPWPHIESGGLKIGLISDTHGKISNEAYQALTGADLIVHAGDICGQDILPELETIAPTLAVLGNNDYPGEYDNAVTDELRFEREGLSFKVVHRPHDIRALDADIIIFGHTHTPEVARRGVTTLINPGSPTRSRGEYYHTVARLVIQKYRIAALQFIELP